MMAGDSEAIALAPSGGSAVEGVIAIGGAGAGIGAGAAAVVARRGTTIAAVPPFVATGDVTAAAELEAGPSHPPVCVLLDDSSPASPGLRTGGRHLAAVAPAPLATTYTGLVAAESSHSFAGGAGTHEEAAAGALIAQDFRAGGGAAATSPIEHDPSAGDDTSLDTAAAVA